MSEQLKNTGEIIVEFDKIRNKNETNNKSQFLFFVKGKIKKEESYKKIDSQIVPNVLNVKNGACIFKCVDALDVSDASGRITRTPYA